MPEGAEAKGTRNDGAAQLRHGERSMEERVFGSQERKGPSLSAPQLNISPPQDCKETLARRNALLDQLKDEILMAERAVLFTLGFDLNIQVGVGGRLQSVT